MNNDDQLEIHIHGDVAEITPHGVWERAFDRREILLRGAGLGAVGLGAMLFGVGCGGGSGSSGATTGAGAAGGVPGKGKTLGISFSGVNEYTINDLTGSLHALQGTEYKLLVRQASFTPERQLADVEDLITQQVSGLSVLPTTAQATSQAVLKAKQAGIPCVNQFWSGKTAGDSAYIGVLMTDNTIGGKLVADHIMKSVPDGGKVLIVMGQAGQGYSEVFTAGIQKALGSAWKVADVQPGNYVRSDSVDAAQTMLTAHPDAKVIVSYAAEMGVAVAGYLKEAGRNDVVHITSDSNQEMVRWMSEGFISADRYLSASQTGFIPLQMLRDFLEKNQKPKTFITRQPQKMITAADFQPKPPPSGVINRNLDPKDPSFGVFVYEDLLPEAKKLVS